MLGEQLKKIIDEKVFEEKNKVKIAKAAKTADEKKKISELKTIIAGIKKGAKDIADGNNLIPTVNEKGQIRVTDVRKISKNLQYTYHHNGEDVSFFKLYSKEAIFVAEVEKFKSWAEKEGISDIIVHYEHDGVGTESWNSYFFAIKK